MEERDFIVGYVGSLGTWYMLKEKLRFFKNLLSQKENAKFLFITSYPEEKLLKEVVKLEINVEKIIITEASREEVPIYLSLVDLGLYFIFPHWVNVAKCAIKQGEYMAMGIPIITNNGVGDVEEIINDVKSGIIVEGFGKGDFENALNRFFQREFSSPKDIRNGARIYFSLADGIKKYAGVYNKLLLN